jgi:hypothetical protein
MTIPELLARHPWMEEPMRAYYRALPELLADRSAGEYVVVKGSELYDTWDTFRDANQFACTLFEPGTFLIQRIDARLLEPLGAVFGPSPAEAPACPG